MKTLSFALLTFLLVACGKTSKKYTAPQKQDLSPEQLGVLLEHQNFSCSDADFCPEGPARLFSLNYNNSSKSALCGAFLIAEDKVVTNSHCLSKCEDMYFSFPTIGGQAQTALCSKILWSDPRPIGKETYSQGVNDFALIQLDRKVSVPPFKLARGGFVPGRTVYPLVTDQLNGLQARLTKLECKVKEVSPAGIAVLENCPVISGNSGSVILNEELEAIGIIFASSLPHGSSRKSQNALGFAFTVDQLQKIMPL